VQLAKKRAKLVGGLYLKLLLVLKVGNVSYYQKQQPKRNPDGIYLFKATTTRTPLPLINISINMSEVIRRTNSRQCAFWQATTLLVEWMNRVLLPVLQIYRDMAQKLECDDTKIQIRNKVEEVLAFEKEKNDTKQDGIMQNHEYLEEAIRLEETVATAEGHAFDWDHVTDPLIHHFNEKNDGEPVKKKLKLEPAADKQVLNNTDPPPLNTQEANWVNQFNPAIINTIWKTSYSSQEIPEFLEEEVEDKYGNWQPFPHADVVHYDFNKISNGPCTGSFTSCSPQ